MSPLRYAALSSLVLFACSPKPAADTAASLEAAQTAPDSTAPGPTAAPQRPCVQHFAAFDTSGDERVSLDEFLAQPHRFPDPERRFQSRDLDSDGALTLEELCAGGPGGRGAASCECPAGGRGPGMGPGGGRGPGRMGLGVSCDERVARFDADGDGTVSEREFQGQAHPHGDPRAMFAARDQDGDGELSREELCAMGFGSGKGPDAGPRGGCDCPMGPGRGGPGGMGPGGMGPGGMGPGGGGPAGRGPGGMGPGAACDERLARFDSDADGSVSEKEFLGQPHPRGDAAAVFMARDRDGDGKLTREELCAPMGRPVRDP